MSEKKLRRLPMAAAALVTCMSAQADYQSPDGNFRVSGFGTLGAVHSSTNDVRFNYLGQGGGAGTTPNFDADSKLAVQGTYKLAPTLSLTTQIMTKYDANATYQPSVDWLFAKWQATPSVTVRAGRLGMPVFMISDFRDVGYANTAVRPALDVYAQVPVSQYNGADINYQFAVGATTFNLSGAVGNASADYASARRKNGAPLAPTEVHLDGQYGLNLQGEMDNGLSFRVGKYASKGTLKSPSIDELVAGTAAFPTLSQHVYDNVVMDSKSLSFTGFGVAYDQDNWVISAEYTKRRSEKFISSTTGWYGNVGYRVGKFTPYFGLSRVAVDHPEKLNPAGTGIGVLDEGVQALLATQKLTQRTTTLGSRWDFMGNAALKVQWDHITKPADSYGLFFTEDPYDTKAQSFLASKRRVNVVTVSLDFVF